MTEQKPLREFWLDLAASYGDPCDFVHTKDPKETGWTISATNIHVIEKSAYDAVLAERDRLLEEMKLVIQAKDNAIDIANLYRQAADKLADALDIPLNKRNGMDCEDFEVMGQAIDDYRKDYPK